MMTDSSFWRLLRADFEILQPHKFGLVWSSVPPLNAKREPLDSNWSWYSFPDASLAARLSALALRGAKALGYDSEDAWYDEVRRSKFVHFTITGSGFETRSDGVKVESVSGSIVDVVKESITLCHTLEAMSARQEAPSETRWPPSRVGIDTAQCIAQGVEASSTDADGSVPSDDTRAASGNPARALFESSRLVTIVRHVDTQQEERWDARMGGNFVNLALFPAEDKIQTCDEIQCECFDEPRIVGRVEPVVVEYGISHWEAVIEPRSEWNRRCQAQVSLPESGVGLVSRYVPRTMYHPTKMPVTVRSAHEESALGPEWSREYIPQFYPRCKYHCNGKSVIVKNVDEEIALGVGWANAPAPLDRFKGPARITPGRDDPAKWVDQWSVPGLGTAHRTRIKAQLHAADCFYWKDPDRTSSDTEAMRLAFSGIAQVLFDSRILTEQFLKHDLPNLVWDSAVSGGWWRLASETPQGIFPFNRGHYWVWLDDSRDWKSLFRGETSEWRAKLLESTLEGGDR
jgi:hypothetical protein